jgi:transposase InsO family protein
VIYGLRHKYAVSKLLKTAEMPRSTYYYYVKRLNKEDKYKEIKEKIREIYDFHKGRYGYRRITMELRNQGMVINHKTVMRLMKETGLFCRVRMKKYRPYRGEAGKIAPNLLERNFKAEKPNEKWVTDVTQFSLFGQKIYLSPIIDLHNSEVVSYDLSFRADFAQVMRMLDSALTKLPDNTGLILHSDQGWQYQMREYQARLKEKGIIQSMSRKGNCFDNAAAENFFSLLKTELIYIMEFHSLDEFIKELNDYIYYYNNHRIKLRFGLSPVQYRLRCPV